MDNKMQNKKAQMRSTPLFKKERLLQATNQRFAVVF